MLQGKHYPYLFLPGKILVNVKLTSTNYVPIMHGLENMERNIEVQ